MALWECGECTTRYAVGAPACPHCGSDLRVNEKTQPPEEQMGKITVHGGASTPPADEPEVETDDGAAEPQPEASGETAAEEPEKAPRRRTRGK
jgi:hypothetical protein